MLLLPTYAVSSDIDRASATSGSASRPHESCTRNTEPESKQHNNNNLSTQM